MIHFNVVDLKECRSEEVISFYWRSVYEQIHYFTVCSTTKWTPIDQQKLYIKAQ